MQTPTVTLRDQLAMSAPSDIPKSFRHVSRPYPKSLDPAEHLTPEQIRAWSEHQQQFIPEGSLPVEVQEFVNKDRRIADDWDLQDSRDRQAQWRYAYADAMLAARGERGRVDDIAQVAQAILPGLLQAHASRNPEDGSVEDDVFGDAQVNGWGSDGLNITFNEGGKSEPASLAEGLAFDAYMLAEAFIEVRRRRYGA